MNLLVLLNTFYCNSIILYLLFMAVNKKSKCR